MPADYSICVPHLLQIQGWDGTLCYGGNQTWYRKFWQRKAGCGPTAAANLLYYLARRDRHAAALVPFDATQQNSFLRLMEDCWRYVTPGLMGVNRTDIFTDGVSRFGSDHGVELVPQTLEIPVHPEKRPERHAVDGFLEKALGGDQPVAFLNLDNGQLQNLESWHWVTLVGYNSGRGHAEMYDQGRRSHIDLHLWLDTTSMGGGLVTACPA